MKKNNSSLLIMLLRHVCGFVLITILTLSTDALASEFGSTCVTPPGTESDEYLKINTALGHLISNISMLDIADRKACQKEGDDFIFCIKKAVNSSECSEIKMRIGDLKKLNEISPNPALGGNPLLKDIMLSVKRYNNLVCLTMPTSRGNKPIVCREGESNTEQDSFEETKAACSVDQSCYTGGNKSQSLFNFSGQAVECLKETINKVFYGKNNCDPTLTKLNPFASFQESLKASIRAALIIYVIFYGFKVVLNNEYVNLDKIASFLFKFILVSYFAVGLGPVVILKDGGTTNNGMVKLALPFLVQATSDFAHMVFGAAGSKGLCEFDINKYKSGYKFYALWDAIDCRIAYYSGMQLMYNTSDLLKEWKKSTVDENIDNDPIPFNSSGAIKILKITGSFIFFTVMFGFAMGGNIMVTIAGFYFIISFIICMIQFVTHYMVCLITLYVMAYISPIFISMALFERTKSYFDSWLKTTLSCAIQPAVAAAFVALLLTMYDSAIYENCQFKRHEYAVNENNFTTFELRLPKNNPDKCRDSTGYKLFNYYTGQGWETRNVLLFPYHYVRDVFGVLVNLLYVWLFTIIFFYFSKIMTQFAADLTGGPVMDAVVASPDQARKALRALGKFLSSNKKDRTHSEIIDNDGEKDGKDNKNNDNNNGNGDNNSENGDNNSENGDNNKSQ